MRHRACIRVTLAMALVSLAAALAGCAASSNTTRSGAGATSLPPPTSSSTTSITGSATTPQGGPSALSVSPTVGSKQSVMRFSYASPAAAVTQARTQSSSALSIVGPHQTGCVGAHDEAVPSEPAGHTVNVAVGPTQLGGPWCAGTYAARVEVLQRPKCDLGMMCPQFIRVVAVLGPVTFTISD